MNQLFAQRLALLMGRMPAADLAREIGVTRSAVSRWLAGQLPALRHLTALADKFGVTIDDLLRESTGAAS